MTLTKCPKCHSEVGEQDRYCGECGFCLAESNMSQDVSNIVIVDNMGGLEFEAFCCELLKQNGYTNVRKTQASGDYGLDVIAEKEGIIYGIQCKNYQGGVGVKAVQEAISGSQFYSCHVPVVLTNSTFTKSAIEMARKTNVKLWDRRTLKELMKAFPNTSLIGQDEYSDSYKKSFFNSLDHKDKKILIAIIVALSPIVVPLICFLFVMGMVFR